MGLVVNPEGAKIQMEGCITMGLGYALTEEVRFQGGNILDRNFGTYKIPRFAWLPDIETVLIDAKDAAPVWSRNSVDGKSGCVLSVASRIQH
jgi:CO/xanthine dehydrogenase Mo-binding subunit